MGICGKRRKLEKLSLVLLVLVPWCVVLVKGRCVGRRRWGLEPFDHSGFYPWAMVVLVACTRVSGVVLLMGFGPVDQGTGCSWWVRKVG